MSHHNSGPRAHAVPVADITDMYSFPAPERPGWIVLVLDTVPFADPKGFLSDAIVHRFRLRALAPAPDDPALFSVGSQEVTVDCTFDPPEGGEDGGVATQRGRCVVSTGPSVEFLVNDEEGGSAPGLRVFAGPRWDPFFDDANALVSTITTGTPAFSTTGTILGDGKNVFGVVVEIETAGLFGDGGPLIAVVGETLIDGRIRTRWERFGRPELENAILGMKNHDQVNRDLEIRDVFNADDVFDLAPDYVGAYRARLDANLAFWDGFDGKTDWPLGDDGAHPLTGVLLADFQILDVSKPYSEDSFLEIERAALAGRSHETCGGRSLNDDCMNTLYTFLISAGNGPRIDDGVHAATRPASRVFPYLQSPNPNPPVHGGH